MYFNYMLLMVVMAACCYGQNRLLDPTDRAIDALLRDPFTGGQGEDPLAELGLFGGGRRGICPCDRKSRTRFVRLPFRNGNALTLRQFNRHVEGLGYLGVYEVKEENPRRPIPRERQRGFEINYGRRAGSGNFRSTSQYRLRSQNRCVRRTRLNRPVSRRNAVFEIATRQAFDTYFSSCPDKYIWKMRCTDYRALQSRQGCPSDRTVLLLLVPKRRNPMDELPLQQIQEDLTRATGVRLCQSVNLRQYFILGDNRCQRLPAPRRRSRARDVQRTAADTFTADSLLAGQSSAVGDPLSADPFPFDAQTELGLGADTAGLETDPGFSSADQGLGPTDLGADPGLGLEAGGGQLGGETAGLIDAGGL